MKNMTLLLVIIGFFICNTLLAPDIHTVYIKTGMLPTANKTTINIKQICLIESNNNPNAVSKENAIGVMQITKGVLKEWNNTHPRNSYQLKDLKKADINIKVGSWYINNRIPELLLAYKIPLTEVNTLIAYNWGIGNLKNWVRSSNKISLIPLETQQYIIKYYQGVNLNYVTDKNFSN